MSKINMMLPQKKSNELEPMKIKTSVSTPTTNPLVRFFRKAGKASTSFGRKFLDIATANPNGPRDPNGRRH